MKEYRAYNNKKGDKRPNPVGLGEEESKQVFEKGFEPLQDAFKWKGHNYEVFDEWTEILSTDQIVAVDYNPEDHMP